MKKYKIFVSGVQKELKEERYAVKDFISNDVLLREYFDVFLFEDYPAKGKSSEKVYFDEVRGCDIYIGILGYKYGIVTKGKISPTEAEFREAQKKQKIILIYIKGENGTKDQIREKGIQKLIQEIKDPKKGYSYRRLNLLHDGQLTNAAILLFGKDQHKFFLQAEVKCVQFPSTEVEKPFTSYHIYDGNLSEHL